jgi:hypothetical protein
MGFSDSDPSVSDPNPKSLKKAKMKEKSLTKYRLLGIRRKKSNVIGTGMCSGTHKKSLYLSKNTYGMLRI